MYPEIMKIIDLKMILILFSNLRLFKIDFFDRKMLKYKNFGRKSLTELIEKLDSMNLQFGMQVDKIMTEEV